MIFKVKDGRSTQTFEGFKFFRSKSQNALAAYIEGEWELWAWDGTELGVSELERYYRSEWGEEVRIIKLTRIN